MVSLETIPFWEGFGTGAALIIAIGPQNAFVLKQGLQKNHVFLTACLCFLIDCFLITLGVTGVGAFLTTDPFFMKVSCWGGAFFLFYYGLRSFRSVISSHHLKLDGSKTKPSFRATILTLLALGFLNPHAYLDAVLLLGSIGSSFPQEQRASFTCGALLASLLWFFSLAYGARFLNPLFKNPKSWKVLDFLIGCLMWGIGAHLIFKFWS